VTALEGYGGIAHSCAWSPDGTRLAFSSDDTTVRVWNVTTGREVRAYTRTLIHYEAQCKHVLLDTLDGFCVAVT